MKADVVVVGGGFCGLVTSLLLARKGMKVVLLERHQLGWGASGRNAGQLLPGFQRDIDQIRNRYGEERARGMWRASVEGLELIGELIRRYKISCDHKAGGYLVAARNTQEIEKLAEWRRVLESIGHLTTRMAEGDEVRDKLGTTFYAGGLYDSCGGDIQPLKYLHGLARAAKKEGVEIHEASPVEAWKIVPGGVAVRTPGGQVEARRMVLAGNAYQGHLVPWMRNRFMLARTSVMVTEVLPRGSGIVPSGLSSYEARRMLHYFRRTGDGRLLFGGGDSASNVVADKHEQARYRQGLLAYMLKVFPQLEGVGIAYSWGGYFAVTTNLLPHIGRMDDTIYYAYGCNGHGLDYTHMAGRMLAEAMCGNTAPLQLFEGITPWPVSMGGALDNLLVGTGLAGYRLLDRLGK